MWYITHLACGVNVEMKEENSNISCTWVRVDIISIVVSQGWIQGCLSHNLHYRNLFSNDLFAVLKIQLPSPIFRPQWTSQSNCIVYNFAVELLHYIVASHWRLWKAACVQLMWLSNTILIRVSQEQVVVITRVTVISAHHGIHIHILKTVLVEFSN